MSTLVHEPAAFKPNARARLCQATDCNRPHFALGLCEKHYRRGRNTRKLHVEEVREMRSLASNYYHCGRNRTRTLDALAARFGICRDTAGKIVRGEVWKCLLPQNGNAFGD